VERAGHEAQSVRLLAFAAFDAQACVIFFVAVTTKSVARHAGLFRLIQHTASLMCSWRRRLPSSDGLKKRGRQPGSSNFVQRFGTVANSRASSLRQNLRRLWAMRSAHRRAARVKSELTSRVPLPLVSISRMHDLTSALGPILLNKSGGNRAGSHAIVARWVERACFSLIRLAGCLASVSVSPASGGFGRRLRGGTHRGHRLVLVAGAGLA
jgi:hypothetical protein